MPNATTKNLLIRMKKEAIQKLNSLKGTLKTPLSYEQIERVKYKIKNEEMKIQQIDESLDSEGNS